MATAKLSDMVSRLGRLPGPPAQDAPDPELLGRFLADRDEAAFAELVRRHGPTVFGVCRRVTGDHHLAEDAFQAVFVVLAAKAGTVRPRAALPAWLYGVAYRTALRARTMTDRRRRREAAVGQLPEYAAEAMDAVEAADLAAVLDAEIARLPEYLRVPVVLCELEGRSRQEAAGQLGIPEGTLSSRLAAARKALAGRLRGRGVALSAAGLTAAFAQVSAASVPPALTAKAVAAATSPGVVPAPVAALSNGVLRIMFAQKLKTVPAALGLVAAAVFATGVLPASDTPRAATPAAPRAALADPPKPAAKPAPAAKKPLPKGPNKILFYRNGHLTLIDPDGKNEKRVSEDRGKFMPSDGKLSPDGKTIAVLIRVQPDDPSPNMAPRCKLYVRGIDDKEPGTDTGVECRMMVWSPDGTRLAASEFEDAPKNKLPVFTHKIIDVKTNEATNLRLPTNHLIAGWLPDDHLLTTSVGGTPEKPAARLHLMNLDGTEHKALTDGKEFTALGLPSPDGTRVLGQVITSPKEEDQDKSGRVKRQLFVQDIATGRRTWVEDLPLNGDLQAYCWSPDGKKIAYSWREVHTGPPEELIDKETESFLVVCDPDGKNAKTIVTEKGRGQGLITIGSIDWR